MGEARVKLAQVTGDDLAGDVEVIIKEAAQTGEVATKRELPPSVQAGASKTGIPVLSEAVRALLIMTGCHAIYGVNHWVVRLEKITKEQEQALAMAPAANRKRFRLQTGVPLDATFEDWRRELAALTGQFTNP